MHVHNIATESDHDLCLPGAPRPEGHASRVVSHLWPVMVTLVALAFAVLVTTFLGLAPLHG